jgi:hypothetical protein
MIWLLESLSFFTVSRTVEGFVICANDEQEARQLASRECASEGKDYWLNDKLTSCVPVPEDKSQVILRSYAEL